MAGIYRLVGSSHVQQVYRVGREPRSRDSVAYLRTPPRQSKQTGIVRPAAEPAMAWRVVADGDPLYRGIAFQRGLSGWVYLGDPQGNIEPSSDRRGANSTSSHRRWLANAPPWSPHSGSLPASVRTRVRPRWSARLPDALSRRRLAAAEGLATSGSVDLLVVDVVGLYSSSQSCARETTGRNVNAQA